MKTLVIAAGIMAALNSSMVWGSRALTALQGSSEPVGLVVWGLALFVIASSLKKRPSAARRIVCHQEKDRSWAGVLPRVADFTQPPRESVSLNARKA